MAQCATPTFSPTAGTYLGTQNVTISTTTAGATIRYTTDGSTPSETNGIVYSGAVGITQNTTLQAMAYESGMADSAVASAAYNIQCATPTFSPGAGVYVGLVTISTTTTGATIRYTTDGSIPSETNGMVYSIAVDIGFYTTLQAIAYETGMTDSAVASAVYDQVCATPTFSPPAGTYPVAQTVTISTTTTGATIRYTIDGSTPSETNGTIYTAPINVWQSQTLKAIAYETSMIYSTEQSGVYTLASSAPQVATPSFLPAPGVYVVAQSVTISTTTAGATIRYTTDGTTPSETNGIIYTVPVNIAVNTTLQAIAYETGMTDSAVLSGFYQIILPPPVITSFSPASGTLPIMVTLLGSGFETVTNVWIGSMPIPVFTIESDNSMFFTVPVGVISGFISLWSPTTGSGRSATGFTVDFFATPTFSPPAGTYTVAQTVTISTTMPGATIRYTTDGSTPSETNGTIYTTPVTVGQSLTLQAMAYETGMADSTVASAAYNIQCASPIFSPVAGSYTASVMVSISCATTGATIRYTTNGIAPTDTYGTVYAGPFTLASSATVHAISYQTGMADSSVVSGAYTINLSAQQVSAPVFSSASGTYTGYVWLALSSATAGATIRYTTDGSTPSETHGIVYSGVVTITQNTTLQAMAYESGMTDSAVAIAAYNIQCYTPSFSVVFGWYDSAQTVTISTATSGATIRYTTDGSTPSETNGIIYTVPVNIAVNTTLQAIAYETGMLDSDLQSAGYAIGAQPALLPPIFNTASGTYTNNIKVTISADLRFNVTPQQYSWLYGIFYTTDGTTPSPTNYTGIIRPGEYVFIDASLTLQAVMSDEPAEGAEGNVSNVTSAAYVITQTGMSTCATPTFSLASGTYLNSQPITISCATPGATIVWTIDGTDPTETNGVHYDPLYGAPTYLMGSGPLKAQAFCSGWNDSSIASAFYSFTHLGPCNIVPPFLPNPYQFGTPSSSFVINYVDVSVGGGGSGGIGWSAGFSLSDNTTNQGIEIVYTLDESTPSHSNGTPNPQTIGPPPYGVVSPAPITNSGFTTAAAVAVDYPVFSDGVIAYLCAQPTSNVNPGSFTPGQTITLSCNTAGATIVYTIDGTTPTPSNGTVYTTPIVLNSTCTLMAIAVLNGYTTSAISYGTYVINICADPIISPPSNLVQYNTYVNFTCATTGATVSYTTDGSTPSETNGTIAYLNGATYYGPFVSTSPTTVQAIAYLTGYADSAVATATYTMQCGTPACSPVPGTYHSVQSVTISTWGAPYTTPFATIVYTTDGSTPNHSSTVYSSPIPVDGTITIKVLAFLTGWVDSDVGVVVYSIEVLPPTITPASENIYPWQWPITATVTPGDTAGATYLYLIGAPPTFSTGLPVSGATAVHIPAPCTLYASGFLPEWNTGSVSATYGNITFLGSTQLAAQRDSSNVEHIAFEFNGSIWYVNSSTVRIPLLIDANGKRPGLDITPQGRIRLIYQNNATGAYVTQYSINTGLVWTVWTAN